MKPKSFYDLPSCIREKLLWDMYLEYDSYESTKADAIHEIMNGNVYTTNKLIIENYFKALSLASLSEIVLSELERVERERTALSKFFNEIA